MFSNKHKATRSNRPVFQTLNALLGGASGSYFGILSLLTITLGVSIRFGANLFMKMYFRGLITIQKLRIQYGG